MEYLKQRLGPLPVWAWGLIFGGLVVGFYYWQQLKDSNGQTITDDNAAAVELDSAPVTFSDAIDGAFTPGTAAGSSLATEVAPESTDTNSAWLIRAVQALIGTGIAPVAAQQALQKYLEGETLTAAESKLVDTAIKKIGGLPPEGTATPTVVAPTTPATVTIKSWRRNADGTIQTLMSNGTFVKRSLADYINWGMPSFSYNAYAYKTYKVKASSETVYTVAAKYKTSVEDLMVINRWKSAPNLIKGTKIKVPDRKGA